jgi:hypothetical protein
MDHNESSTSNSQGRKLKIADKSLDSTAQLELDRDPQTFGSNKDTMLFRGPFRPAIDSDALHPLKLDKIAIPRSSNFELLPSKRRVSRACDPCREQKTKCTGQRPSCQRCRQCDITCIYSDKKRERDVKFSYIAGNFLVHDLLMLYSGNRPISNLEYRCTRISYGTYVPTSILN